MNRRQFSTGSGLALLAFGALAQEKTGIRPEQADVAGVDSTLAGQATAAVRGGESVQDAFARFAAVAAKAMPFLHMTALVAKAPAVGGADGPGDVRRLYSSVPSAYPVGGWKHLGGSEWAEHVLQQQRVLVAAGDVALARYFPDHALLRSLGTRTLVNVPVVVCRRTVGAFAFLCQHEGVAPDALAQVVSLAPSAAAVFVLGAGEQA
ncbi:hypothetical protein [Cupriavidus sp. PET2-C1]